MTFQVHHVKKKKAGRKTLKVSSTVAEAIRPGEIHKSHPCNPHLLLFLLLGTQLSTLHMTTVGKIFLEINMTERTAISYIC